MAVNPIQTVLTILLTPLQEIEDAAHQLLNRTLDNATGYTLDCYGKLVGQPRGVFTDDEDYRRVIRARILANKSSGTIRDVLRVARAVLNDAALTLRLKNHGNATQVLTVLGGPVESEAVKDVLMSLVHDAQEGGVRTIVEMSTQPASTWLKFDTPGQGFDRGRFLDARD